MKTIILSISISLFTFLFSNAQTVNEIPIKDINVEYIQIVGTTQLLSNKVTIELDFGQENKFFSTKSHQIKDEFGKSVKFNSMIDALNFLSKNGYDFIQAYAFAVGNQNVYHYLLRKSDIEINELEEPSSNN